jgi:hypothetical protein
VPGLLALVDPQTPAGPVCGSVGDIDGPSCHCWKSLLQCKLK